VGKQDNISDFIKVKLRLRHGFTYSQAKILTFYYTHNETEWQIALSLVLSTVAHPPRLRYNTLSPN
jgi:hypothetical protein